MATSTVAELYGGDPMLSDGRPTPNNSVGTPKVAKLVTRHEQYKKSIDAAIEEGARGDVIKIGQVEGTQIAGPRSKRLYQKELAYGLDQNGLQKGHRELLVEHMEHLEKSGGYMAKEWTLTNPVPSGLVPYDLEAPAKLHLAASHAAA